MCGLFDRILNKGNKSIEVAKSGDNYYSLMRVDNEVVMAVIQPPASYSGHISVGGEVSVYDAQGKLQVGRGKITNYGEPFILFNPNNKAGLQLINAKAEAKNLLPEALKERPDIKIETDKLDQSEVITVHEHERIVLPTSTVLQLNEDRPASIIRTPKIEKPDKQILNSLLQLMVVSLVGGEQVYRSNIMLLDPGDNKLKIAARYNMDGYRDKNITLSSSSGGAGQALKFDITQRVDFNTTPHQLMNIDPLQVWDKMKSLYALPIHDSEGAALGVLSIDTDNQLPNTRMYNDQDFDRAMNLAAESFGLILEKDL